MIITKSRQHTEAGGARRKKWSLIWYHYTFSLVYYILYFVIKISFVVSWLKGYKIEPFTEADIIASN